ncbi:MAG TPA: hypothetical protein ENN12_00750 [Epsilonproteobacteria bacterium]|nr:hypothetical protein [Campylobacterota bacterium]
MKKIITKILLASLIVIPALADEKKLLVVLTSEDSLTQFMSLVLANEAQSKDANVSMLLCGKAGDLAIKGGKEVLMKPNDKSPQMLLDKLIKGGGNVEVCPPYLPNNQKTKEDLTDGIKVASPSLVADSILDKDTKILSY